MDRILVSRRSARRAAGMVMLAGLCLPTGAWAQASGGTISSAPCEQRSEIVSLNVVDLACGERSRADSRTIGSGSTAIGFSAQSTTNGTAIGSSANAGVEGVAAGTLARAEQTGTAVGVDADAGFGSVSLGFNASAAGPQSTALGLRAVAAGQDGLAIGRSSRAEGMSSVALGANSSDQGQDLVVSLGNGDFGRRLINVVDGVNATDAATVGQLNGAVSALQATDGQLSTRIDQTVASFQAADVEINGRIDQAVAGYQAAEAAINERIDAVPVQTGSGPASVQGVEASATGAGAIAFGVGAIAEGENSIAIGAGATARRDDSVVIGNSDSVVSLPGVGFGNSDGRRGQDGNVRFVTTDATGTLGTASYSPADIGNLQTGMAALQGAVTTIGNELGTMRSQISALGGELGEVRRHVSAIRDTMGLRSRQANAGIAAAMALGGTFLPPDKTVALSFNLATYRGEQGYSGSLVAQVNRAVWVTGGFAGSSAEGSSGGRVGVTFGW